MFTRVAAARGCTARSTPGVHPFVIPGNGREKIESSQRVQRRIRADTNGEGQYRHDREGRNASEFAERRIEYPEYVSI